MPLPFFGGKPAPPLSPETILTVVVLALGPLAAHFRVRWLGWWERPVARLARRKRWAMVVAAVSPLLLRALLLPWFPIPEPRNHDEFSFLLAADTFAHGRLVNTQHPFWVHFESMHILARPVYASAFPIAQAAALAAGKILLGHGWAGVWLSAGLMCGAICWMLEGWLPPRWALLGAILVILRFGVSSYWMNTYWGGFLAAAGGAFALGALPRMRRATHWRYAAVMGFGLALLANSRPFEGALFGLVIAVALLGWGLGKQGPPWALTLWHIVLPLALLLALAGAGMGYYFARVTGKPWLAPYVLYRQTMTMAPHFLFQEPRPQPLYNNREMRLFYVAREMNDYFAARRSLPADLVKKTAAYWHFYLGPLLTIPFLTLPLLWRDRRTRPVLLMAAAFPLALVGQVWHNPHYAAPATGLVILVVILGLRRLRLWRWRRRPVGLVLVRSLPMACAVMLLVQIAAGRVASDRIPQASWRWPPPGGVARARILKQLETSGEKHLVFVRYGLGHDPGDEWVYNGAEMDGSRVVWARELDRESNAKLMRYFGDRRVWLVEPDRASPLPVLYRDAPFRPMPFVPLGAPGIEVLHSAAEVRDRVLKKAQAREDTLLSCDVWTYYFTEATGVEGPDVVQGCYSGSDRGQKVSFEHWFSWLKRQR